MRHTRWSPIVCRHCGARIRFDRRQWLSAAWPLIAVGLVLLGLAFLVKQSPTSPVLFYGFLTLALLFVLVFVRWTWLILIKPKLTVAAEP